jgi:hypothetical protein
VSPVACVHGLRRRRRSCHGRRFAQAHAATRTELRFALLGLDALRRFAVGGDEALALLGSGGGGRRRRELQARQLLGAERLDLPVGAPHDGGEHERHAGGLRREEAVPEAAEPGAGAERQVHGHGGADEVEGEEVDAGAHGRARRAAEHAAPRGLRAVAQLAQPQDGHRRRRQPHHRPLRREQLHPLPAQRHGPRHVDHADRQRARQRHHRRHPRAAGLAGAQLVAHLHAHRATISNRSKAGVRVHVLMDQINQSRACRRAQ